MCMAVSSGWVVGLYSKKLHEVRMLSKDKLRSYMRQCVVLLAHSLRANLHIQGYALWNLQFRPLERQISIQNS